MDRLQKVVDILDAAIGGPDVGIAMHRAFWRGLTRDQFVTKKVLGLDLLVVGDGAASNLVKALRGQAPFGVDLDDPPPGAQFSRMPSGRPPVSDADIDFIEQWIDDGCPAGAATGEPGTEPGTETPSETVNGFSWRRTNAPDAGARHDDVYFVTPQLGWAVNSDGRILRTDDGGASWTVQFESDGLWLRCVGFTSETSGWVGTVSPPGRLLQTSNGGETWRVVRNLPPEAPMMICGLWVVNEDVVYAAGTNYPFPAHEDLPPRMMKTLDGGATWTAWDMTEHASNLIDTYFTDPGRGWVVGGLADPSADPGQGSHRSENVRAVVLRTEDGGLTWTNKIADLAPEPPLGEWGWKIHFVDDRVGFVSLESEDRGAILRTDDGGETWERFEINDPQRNKNLEGIGFVDVRTGWVGGWGDADFVKGFSSSTLSGGQSWDDANHIGLFINRFRFLGDPIEVGYAAGLTVYKYTDEPLAAATERAALPMPVIFNDREPLDVDPPLQLPVVVPEGASRLVVNIWERYGRLVRRLVDEESPAAGPRTIAWDHTDDNGRPLNPGRFIVRVTAGDVAESRIVRMAARHS